MDDDLLQFGLKAFVTLIVVVDPLGVVPSFVALTSELGSVEKRKTLGRSLVIAFRRDVVFPRRRPMVAFLSRRHRVCLCD
jgi:small neutral amino acid transporter SnatA (MarC family)